MKRADVGNKFKLLIKGDSIVSVTCTTPPHPSLSLYDSRLCCRSIKCTIYFCASRSRDASLSCRRRRLKFNGLLLTAWLERVRHYNVR